jgi:hypothetical protein
LPYALISLSKTFIKRIQEIEHFWDDEYEITASAYKEDVLKKVAMKEFFN